VFILIAEYQVQNVASLTKIPFLKVTLPYLAMPGILIVE